MTNELEIGQSLLFQIVGLGQAIKDHVLTYDGNKPLFKDIFANLLHRQQASRFLGVLLILEELLVVLENSFCKVPYGRWNGLDPLTQLLYQAVDSILYIIHNLLNLKLIYLRRAHTALRDDIRDTALTHFISIRIGRRLFIIVVLQE